MPAIILFFQNHLENYKRVPIDQVCQYKLWKDRYSKISSNLKAFFSSDLDILHLLLHLLELSLSSYSSWCQSFTAWVVTISQLTQINEEDTM